MEEESFKEEHRKIKTAFTRNRKLTFPILVVLLLKKSLKSLQLTLNEFTSTFNRDSVTNSAFTKARHNLSHTAS